MSHHIIRFAIVSLVFFFSEAFSVPLERRSPIQQLHINPTPRQLIHTSQQISGGQIVTMSSENKPLESPVAFQKTLPVLLGSFCGSFGVIYSLSKAVWRVLPVALEPFQEGSALSLTPAQWCIYAVTCLLFAYGEGYKAFHLKFCPMVVRRSLSMKSIVHFGLAPFYSMGMFHATRKRMITSWSVSLGVTLMVAAVKRMPPVWRCIVDAGVVVGLSMGSLSILYHFLVSWTTGLTPAVDACMPVPAATKNKVA